MSVARFSVKNPVLVNIVMVVITVVGTWSLLNMPQELVPDISFPWVFINVIDPGVSPEEMEKLVVKPIEDEIHDVDGITNISSTAREGGAFIWVKFETMPEDEFDKRYQDLKAEVDKVKLPETAEDPMVDHFRTQDFMPMISVVFSGDIPEREMKSIAEDMRDDIADIPNISRVSISGVRDREIWVEVDPEKLERFNLSMNQIGEAIRAKNLNLSAGEVKLGRWEWAIRTVGEMEHVAELENVILRADPMGNHVRLKDVARVSDTFEETEIISRFNGKPSVTLSVAKKQQGNSIDLIDRIKEIVADYRATRIPPGLTVTLTNDNSIYINDILDTLKSNAWMGMILVALALFFFLGWRQALYAVIGIPIALAATFGFMKFTGHSINGSSLFALVLVLGMLVDDAIVVIENCFRYLQMGYRPRQAAVLGTREVIRPVLSSAATTIAAFLPLMLLPGIIGDFMRIIPIVVSLALVASLFESFVILPAHISEWSKKSTGRNDSNGRILRERPFVDFKPVQNWYRRLLGRVLRRRYWVIAAVTMLMVVSVPIAFMLGVDLFADEEIPQFRVFVTMPEGTRIEVTDQTIRQLENLAMEIPPAELENVVSKTGIMELEGWWQVKPSVGELFVELVNHRERDRELDEIMNEMRAKAERIPGIQTITFDKVSSGPPTGAPVELKVKGEDFDELQRVAGEVKAALRAIDGVYDIKDDFETGSRELKLRVDEEKAALYGLTVGQVAASVYNAFQGSVVTTYREGDEEIDVRVRYRRDARQRPADLANLKIQTPSKKFIILKDVATIDRATRISQIKRDDRERAIKITANVDDKKITSIAANQEVGKAWPAIAARHPGYSLEFGGEFTEFTDAFKNLGLLFALGVAIMFTIMAAQFGSIAQPIIIFMAVIFAFWGAVMGLFVIGSPFSINNLFGLVALAGVAVNNSIVLIEFINNSRARGVSRWRSILQAGKTRVRPVLLTSVTTVLGLAPMAIGLGGYSVVWGPLATVIVWGLSASSILTLFIIPSLYAIVGDIKRFFLRGRFLDARGRLSRWEEKRRLEEELARLDRNGVEAISPLAEREPGGSNDGFDDDRHKSELQWNKINPSE